MFILSKMEKLGEHKKKTIYHCNVESNQRKYEQIP